MEKYTIIYRDSNDATNKVTGEFKSLRSAKNSATRNAPALRSITVMQNNYPVARRALWTSPNGNWGLNNWENND